MRKLIMFVILCLTGLAAHAQQAPSSTGNITASGTNCLTTNACINLTLITNTGGTAVTVSGTWSATLKPEQSADNGVTWSSAGADITSNGLTTYTVVAMTNFRVRASALASGTAVVFINSGATPGSAAGTINGVVVSGTPTTGQVPTATSATTATWQTGSSGTGTVTSIATTAPITGGTITATGTIACATCVTSSSPGAGVAHFAGSTQAVTSSAIVGADMTANTVTATQLAPQYSKLRCEPGLGDGLNAVTAGTYLQSTCYNDSGVTWTITGIKCFTDNSGTSTLNAAGNTLGALLTGAVTCTSSFAAGTQSANVALTSGDYIKFTFVADGTSKQTTWVVSMTQ